MKNNRIQALVLSLMGLSICTHASNAAQLFIEGQNGGQNNGASKRNHEVGMDTRPKVQRTQHDAHVSKPPQKSLAASQALDQLIEAGIHQHPLPAIETVRYDLLDSGFLENMGDWISRAIDKKEMNALMVIGGLYHSNMDYDKAKPFVFWGAKHNNADALWLLNCMWRKKELDLSSKELGEYLLTKAVELGSMNAKIYAEGM